MLIDTSAWIELLALGEGVNRVREVMLREESQTLVTTIAEVVDVASKRGMDPTDVLNAINKYSKIIFLDSEIAALAGKLNFERKKLNSKWGMMDSFLLAASLTYGGRILTKDRDFAGLENVEIL